MIAARAALGNQSFKGQSLSSKREQLIRNWGLTHADTEPIERAIRAAWNARLSAYAPYSHYHVGASVLASTGGIWVGANIENSCYGLTLCAERVALASARLHEGSALMLVCIVKDRRADYSMWGMPAMDRRTGTSCTNRHARQRRHRTLVHAGRAFAMGVRCGVLPSPYVMNDATRATMRL